MAGPQCADEELEAQLLGLGVTSKEREFRTESHCCHESEQSDSIGLRLAPDCRRRNEWSADECSDVDLKREKGRKQQKAHSHLVTGRTSPQV